MDRFSEAMLVPQLESDGVAFLGTEAERQERMDRAFAPGFGQSVSIDRFDGGVRHDPGRVYNHRRGRHGRA